MWSIDFRTSTRRRQCAAPPPSPAGCRCGFCSACLCCTTSWWRTGRKWAGPVHDWLPEASALCCMEVLPYCSLAMRRRYPAEGGVRPPLWGPGRRPPASEPVLHLRCVALSDEDPEHRPELYPGRSGDRPSRTGYHTEAGGGDGALRPAARAAGGLCANGPVPGTGRSRST